MTDYAAAVEFLLVFVDYEKMAQVKYDVGHYDLGRVEALMEVVGSPQRAFPAVHIAGTKGKGSTATMVRAILGAAGKRAGLYTQPHLVDMTERATVDGEPISQVAFAAVVDEMRPYVERLREERPHESPTFFELVTTLAFRHFAKEAVDFGVIEVGLGGRLDATNVCAPAVCGISLIDFDHTAQLGNTLDKIAFEKAGIVKPGVPVVSWPQPPEAAEVIARVAAARGAPLIRVGEDVTVRDVRLEAGERPVTRFTVRGRLDEYPDLALPMLGRRQAVNAALAVGLVEELAKQGRLELTRETVARGLAAASAPARMEVFPGSPTVLLDGAHNVISIRSVCETLDELFPGRRVVLVFAAAADKDVAGMLELLLPRTRRAVFTRSRSPRAMAPPAIRELAGGAVEAETCDDALDAFARAKAGADPEDLILVTGSFYLAGLIRPVLL